MQQEFNLQSLPGWIFFVFVPLIFKVINRPLRFLQNHFKTSLNLTQKHLKISPPKEKKNKFTRLIWERPNRVVPVRFGPYRLQIGPFCIKRRPAASIGRPSRSPDSRWGPVWPCWRPSWPWLLVPRCRTPPPEGTPSTRSKLVSLRFFEMFELLKNWIR